MMLHLVTVDCYDAQLPAPCTCSRQGSGINPVYEIWEPTNPTTLLLRNQSAGLVAFSKDIYYPMTVRHFTDRCVEQDAVFWPVVLIEGRLAREREDKDKCVSVTCCTRSITFHAVRNATALA
jgi:hypothetical protein